MAKIHWIEDEPVILIKNDDGLVLGFIDNNGEQYKIRITYEDMQYPMLITGAMGRGKTTLADNIIAQLIEAGYGVLVFDPQSPLAERTLATACQAGRLNDVIYLDLGDEAYPPALSFMRGFAGGSKAEISEALLFAFKAVYDGQAAEGMVRLMSTLQAMLDIALSDKEATLFDLFYLATKPAYVKNMLRIAQEQGLSFMSKLFWEDYQDMSKSAKQNYALSAKSRIGAMLRNDHVTNCLCHPYGIDFRRAIRDQKVIIVDAGSPLVEESRPLFGAVLLAHIYLASRALGANLGADGKELIPRLYVVLDEADMILNRGLFKAFNAKLRQFGVSQIYLTQSMANFDSETAEVMMDNHGTAIAMGTRNPKNAILDAKLFDPLTPEDLMGLSLGTVATSTRYRNNHVHGFLMQTYNRLLSKNTDLNFLKRQAKQNIPLLTGDATTRTGLISAHEVQQWLAERDLRDILYKDITVIEDENNDKPDRSQPIPE